MDRTPSGTPSTSSRPAPAGTGTEFRSLAAGTSMERRPEANARTALT